MNSKRLCSLSTNSLLNGKSAALIASATVLVATTTVMAETQRPGNQGQIWRNTATGKPAVLKQGGVAAPEGPGPSNDNCASAATLFDGNTAFTNLNATNDGPTHASCLSFGDDNIGADIWYNYTATQTGTMLLSLCGSGYDTRMAVYSGCGCPATDGTLLACNDDFCALQSFITLPVLQGNCYKIRIGGYTPAGEPTTQGTGNISLTYAAPLSNDNCVDRVDAFEGVTLFDTTGATTDGPAHGACTAFGDSQVGADIWFNYTATQTGFLRIETCGSSYDTRLAVYNGCSCDVSDANLIGCNDDTCGLQSRVQLDVVAGQCVKIRVGGYTDPLGAPTTTGPGQLTIGYVVNPCPNPDHPCNQTGGPGCADADCCNTVCAIDPFCCETEWDGICVDESFQFCSGGCVAKCPPGSYIEQEPCGADSNGGCNTVNLACETIQCGDVVCGTHWAEFDTRDTDWYCFTVTEPGTVVTWSVVSEFPALSVIVNQACVGVSTASGTCPWEATAVLGPGTYFAVVAPNAFAGLPCGNGNNDYVATLNANCAPPCAGDINLDGSVDMDDLLILLRNWGPCQP